MSRKKFPELQQGLIKRSLRKLNSVLFSLVSFLNVNESCLYRRINRSNLDSRTAEHLPSHQNRNKEPCYVDSGSSVRYTLHSTIQFSIRVRS